MSSNWTCSSCGHSNPADAFQCSNCGTLNYGGGEAEEPALKKAKSEAAPADPSFDPFPYALVGKTVELQGLVAKPELNGRKGVVKDFGYDTMRYTIEVEGGLGSFKLKRENLNLVAPPPPPGGPTVGDPLLGKTVTIHGLSAKPELNGARGVVKELDVAAGRYTVEVEGGKGNFKLKPDNLIPPPEAPVAPPPPTDTIAEGKITPVPGRPGVVMKTLSVSGNDKGAIIGKGGEQIKKMREESGAYITLDVPPGDLDLAILVMKGSQDQVEAAEKLVQEILNRPQKPKWEDWKKDDSKKDDQSWENWKKPTKETKLFDVDRPYIAGLIGKGGCNLKEMSEKSGCKISFQEATKHDYNAAADKQICVLSGNTETVPAALELVTAKINEVMQGLGRTDAGIKPYEMAPKKPADDSWGNKSQNDGGWGNNSSGNSWGSKDDGGGWSNNNSWGSKGQGDGGGNGWGGQSGQDGSNWGKKDSSNDWNSKGDSNDWSKKDSSNDWNSKGDSSDWSKKDSSNWKSNDWNSKDDSNWKSNDWNKGDDSSWKQDKWSKYDDKSSNGGSSQAPPMMSPPPGGPPMMSPPSDAPPMAAWAMPGGMAAGMPAANSMSNSNSQWGGQGSSNGGWNQGGGDANTKGGWNNSGGWS